MPSDAARLATELHQHVIAPLVTGAVLHPVDLIEPPLAQQAAQAGAESLHGGDASVVDLMRVRHIRLLAPVDTLPAPGRAEWLMAAALSNLLIAANADTNTLLSPNKTRHAIAHAASILDHVPPVDTVGEALRRHATFARLMQVERVDVHVSWWSGSAVYRGCAAPKRLMAWPGLRRVRIRNERLALPDMMVEADPLRDSFDRVLSTMLEATPLTDLASCTRPRPRFRWTGPILSLAATDPGHALCVRVLRHGAGSAAVDVLRSAIHALHGCQVPWAVRAASSIADELAAYPA